MQESSLIILGVVVFTVATLVLVLIILISRSRLVPSGTLRLVINNDPEYTFEVSFGDKLLNILSGLKVFIPSACGGKGTCGQCKVRVLSGGGSILSTEKATINKGQERAGFRLACQLAVKGALSIELPPEIFSVKKWMCKVRSNKNVATFIKELILELPEGEEMDFRSGGYIQIEAPPHTVDYTDFIIEEKYKETWDKFKVWDNTSKVTERVVRAYSMANCPAEKGIITLNVRIATPPPNKPNAPTGQMSSFIFNLKTGDEVAVFGPYGEFFARDTSSEMIFIGGGAGMAPMRSHIFDQLKRLKSKRRISFWYGARSLSETFYTEDFNQLALENNNFNWHLALSNPEPNDEWEGLTGFIHQVLFDEYLKDHPAPEDAEYYLCGPPMMLSAVIEMLEELGVDPENILFDDFG
ncbi:MAG: NADH:ubiquinone reductase (Na(+)-transporting) subunit F [Deltaproteobacteria bacterium]|nr:NADH:ubiquinone reductase (Na(+)-transporting) subunit F [Deltaproteobacteria bacterium]